MATGGILGYAESDSEDELPSGWEERCMPDGRVYYCSHNDRNTQWIHPRTGKRKKVTGDLPPGWICTQDEQGTTVYRNESENKTSYTDPRLAFAVEEEEQTDPSRLPRQKFDANTKALAVLYGLDLTGKTAFITGASAGIGWETSRSLALHNAHVVMACRDVSKAEKKRAEILAEKPSAKVDILQLDLSSLTSVRQCAKRFCARNWPLHMLILNAGTFADTYERTEDGLEKTFQVNHLGHFYLTKLLCGVLSSSSPSRVVVVSSESHRRAPMLQPELSASPTDLTLQHLSPGSSAKYWYLHAYNLSKFCNNCFAFALNKRMQPQGVTVTAVHPGNMIYSELPKKSCLMRFLFTVVRPFTKSLQQGAATTVLCAASPDYETVGGIYMNNCCPCPPHLLTMDHNIQEAIWTISDDVVNLFESKQDNQ